MSPEPQFNEVPVHELRREPLRWNQPMAPHFVRLLLYAGIPLVILLGVAPELVVSVLRIVLEFTLGWARFLIEHLPQVRPSAAEVVFSLIVIALLAGVLHATVRGMYRTQGRWRAGWTCGLLVMAGMLFAIGTAVAGVGRQCVALGQLPSWVHEVGGRVAARRSQSKNNLKQIGLALHNYHDTNNSFPAGGTFDALGQPLHSWVTPLLPYIDQAPLFEQIRHDLPWTAPENRTAFETELLGMRIPVPTEVPRFTTAGYAVASYAGNAQLMGPNQGLAIRQVTDGTSNTIAAGEVFANPRAWGDPRNWRDPGLGLNASPEGFGSPWRGGGCNMLFADGAVKFLSQKTDPAVLRKLATPSGGEEVNTPD